MGASKRWAIAATALAAFAFSVALDWAQNEVNVQFHAFEDTRGVTVLSPTVDLDKDFTDRTGVRIKFGVDAITAASDSCARCHQEGARNQRRVGSVNVTRKFGDTQLSVGGEYSTENFYRSTTLMTSLTRNLNAGNTTVAGGFSFSWNQPQLHPSRATETQLEPDGFVAVTQTLSKTTIAQAGYELSHISGYQTDPFLRVMLNGQLVIGNVPDQRTRQTFSVKLRQALPADTFLQADYRRYHDTWSLNSNDVTVGVTHHFSPVVLAGFSYRWYDQSAVYFYQPEYFGAPEFFSADFRLIPFTSGVYSGSVVLTPHGGLWRLPDGTAVTVQYDRYRASTGFEAGILSTGLRVPWK